MAEGQRNGNDGRQRQPSAFQRWMEGEGLPIYRGSSLPDLYTLQLSPWPRMGQPSAFVSMAEQEEDSGVVTEIAPGGHTEVQHHLFESVVFILNGRGATSFWQDGGRKQTVEWQRGSLFAPPLNSHYQHFNLDGSSPVRMFSVGNAWLQRRQYKTVREAVEAYRDVTLDDVHRVLKNYPLSRSATVAIGPLTDLSAPK